MRRMSRCLVLSAVVVVGCVAENQAPGDDRILGQLSDDEEMALCSEMNAFVWSFYGDREAYLEDFCTWIAVIETVEQRASSCGARFEQCLLDFAELASAPDAPTGCGELWTRWPETCGATVRELYRCSEEQNLAFREMIADLSCDSLPASTDEISTVPLSAECAWVTTPACAPTVGDDNAGAPRD